jgi:hypothetical protein
MILRPDISTCVKKRVARECEYQLVDEEGFPAIPTDAALVINNIKFGAVLLPMQPPHTGSVIHKSN